MMRTKDIQAIIFDMGGTLYDTPREIVLMVRFIIDFLDLNDLEHLTDSEILAITGEADDLFDARLTQENVDPYWLPSFEDSVEYDEIILAKLGVQGDLHEMSEEAHRAWEIEYEKTKPKLIESCRPVLEELETRGYKLGIASNRRNDPVPHLKSSGILDFFDVIEYSCVPGYRKPSPYMLIHGAAELGINPMKCAYVGDKVYHDVGAARNAEFLPILIVWCGPEESAKASSDTIVVDHINGLLGIFGNRA